MEKKKSRLSVTSVICFLLSLVLIGLYFMPLWTDEDYSANDAQEALAQEFLDSDESMKHFDVKDFFRPSLFFFTKYFHYNGEDYYKSHKDPHKEAVISTVFMAAPCLAGILIALLSFAKLPFLMLLIEAAGACAFFVDADFAGVASKIEYRGYLAGIAYQAYLPCFAVLAFFTILLFIFKKSYKRALKKQTQSLGNNI